MRWFWPWWGKPPKPPFTVNPYYIGFDPASCSMHGLPVDITTMECDLCVLERAGIDWCNRDVLRDARDRQESARLYDLRQRYVAKMQEYNERRSKVAGVCGRWKVWDDSFKSTAEPRLCDIEVIAKTSSDAQAWWNARGLRTPAERELIDAALAYSSERYGNRAPADYIDPKLAKVITAVDKVLAERAPAKPCPRYFMDGFSKNGLAIIRERCDSVMNRWFAEVMQSDVERVLAALNAAEPKP